MRGRVDSTLIQLGWFSDEIRLTTLGAKFLFIDSCVFLKFEYFNWTSLEFFTGKKMIWEKKIRAAIHQTQDNDQLGWHTRPMNKSIWQRRQLVQRGLHTAHKCRYQRPDGATHKTLSLLIRSGGCVIERCSWVTHGRCQPNANVFQRKFKREKNKKKVNGR